MASLGTWPESIHPLSCRLVPQINQRVNASPGSGSEQAVDMLRDRWMMYLTLPRRRFAEAAAVEAYLNRFRGQVNWADAWHFARPEPNGTLRGSLYTNASAAQGAAALQVQARRGRVNVQRAVWPCVMDQGLDNSDRQRRAGSRRNAHTRSRYRNSSWRADL
jgi:hypothetical protein